MRWHAWRRPWHNAIGIKAAVQADELFRKISEVTQSWSADTMSPWLVALEGYPRFLMEQQRAGEVPPAIARYQAALKTAHGPDTGWLEDPSPADHRYGAWAQLAAGGNPRGSKPARPRRDSRRAHQRARLSRCRDLGGTCIDRPTTMPARCLFISKPSPLRTRFSAPTTPGASSLA